MAERLRDATSPYLRQHADNPVDWYPWGDQAFDDARRRDVPVFLSVGYSACHWCHVMAHESFENPHVAAIMNDRFVNIKVDREELPAIDARYMQATQALTGMGGWPMSVWLDHDRRAWYAGTYFPSVPSHGSPSFVQVLQAISEAWLGERANVAASAMRVHDALRSLEPPRGPLVGQGPKEWEAAAVQAVDQLAAEFDPVDGGFGGAPKFPPTMALLFLLRWSSYLALNDRDADLRIAVMLDTTFERMAHGGMFDQLGGGFARYSVDRTWTVPHFEKMLYDNALLLRAYTEWYAATASPIAARVVEQTVQFLLRDLRTDEGAFASALDADSIDVRDGISREGAYYAWTYDEVREVAGEQACAIFGVTPEGTFEHGLSVLRLCDQANGAWQASRAALLERRGTRPAPARDGKVVTSWNALAIEALVIAARVFERDEWLAAALTCADYLVSTHLDDSGRLLRTSLAGQAAAHAPGVLEDHATLAKALAALSMATADRSWQELAIALLGTVRAEFAVDVDGAVALWDTSQYVRTVLGLDDPQVDPSDGVTPSGWSMAVDAAVTVSSLVNDTVLRDWANRAAAPLVPLVSSHPRFAGAAAGTLVAMLDGPREVAVAATPGSPLARVLVGMTAPGAVYSFDPQAPLLAGRATQGESLHVCRNFVCDAPTSDPVVAARLLGVR